MKRTIFILSLVAGGLLASVSPSCAQGTRQAEVARNLQVFGDIYRQLETYYVDTLSADTTIEWAIQGMLERVDPFTVYYRDNDDELRQMSTGQYAGIGSLIRWSKRLNRTVISQPYEGTPSYEAGLKAGDVLQSIDGVDVEGKPTSEVSTMLRGDAGTNVEVTVQRPGQNQKPLTFTITRRNIRLPQITYYGMENDSVGYVLLSQFTTGVAQDMRHAVSDLKSRGMRRLVIDLRENPGGVIDEAVSIVNLFVPKGEKVVYTRGKVASSNREYYTTSEPLDTVTPIVVMVNSGSASAAEILSGALQDMDRAVVVGERTYGKGLVQSIRELPYNRNLKLTVSRYYIPSGRCIQAYDYRHLNADGSVGMVPDSLTHVFHTRGGRPVRDGGGIKPDVQAEPDSLASFVYDVAASDALFDFVTEYMLRHPQVDEPGAFRIEEEEYARFADYVQESGFTANRRSEEVLQLLKKAARLEGYYDDAKEEFDQLEAHLKSDMRTGILNMKEQIAPFLEAEIMARAYGEQGAVKQQLRYDAVYKRALDVVSNNEEMKKLLILTE